MKSTFCWPVLLLLGIWSATADSEIRIRAVHGGQQACFENDVNNALNQIGNTDPLFAEMIATLKAKSGFVHVIIQSNGVTTSTGFDDGTQEIEFNPSMNRRFFTDHVCADALAALVHELYHAVDNETGHATKRLQKNRTISIGGVAQSEIDATRTENLFRRLSNPKLCPRVAYGGISFPQILAWVRVRIR